MRNRPAARAIVRTLVLGFVLLACAGTGSAFAASGTITVPDTRTNAISVSISFTTSGGDVASSQVERRSASLAGDTCGGYGAWAAASGVSPTSPWSDSAVADGQCYEYRLRITDTVATTTYASSVSTVRVDRTAPTGTIDSLPAIIGGTQAVTGTASDSGTDVANVAVSYSGAGAATPCPGLSGSPWSCDVDTSAMPDGMYVIELLVTDRAGNVSSPITTTTMVDGTAPTASLAGFTEVTGTQYIHAIGSTMYYNSAQSGSFRISVTATDSGTGVERVAFPTLASGWTPSATSDYSAPYEMTYSFFSGVGVPGSRVATAYDFAGRARPVSFSVQPDSGVPTGGSGVTSASGSITYTPSVDALSGIATTQLQRRLATDTAGSCGTPGTFSNIGAANPGSPFVDSTIPAGQCATYRMIATDNVGLTRTVNLTGTARLAVVDVTPPIVAFGSYTELTGSQYTHAVGSTMWFNPAQAGSFRVTATATDAASGVNGVYFPSLGTGWSPGTTHGDATAPYEVVYVFAPGAANPGLQSVSAVDNAGNSATNSYTVGSDVTAPTGGSISAAYAGGSVTVTHASGTDAQSGLGVVAIERRSAVSSFGSCAAFGAWSQMGASNPASPYVDSAIVDGTCYEYRLVQEDNVGNQAIVAGNVVHAIIPAVRVQLVGSSTVAEGGATSTYTLVLSRQPTADVAVDIGTDPQLTNDGGTRTFTAANWAVPQQVTVTAVDDSISEGPHQGTVTSSATSSDPDFQGLSGAPLTFDIVDNDVSGVAVSVSGGVVDVTEGGSTDSVQVHLDSEPTANVTITPTHDAQTTSTGSVTFTPANWNLDQTITVSAVDDAAVEGTPHAGTVGLSTTSADPFYAALTLADLTVAVTDNDAAGVVVAPASGIAVSEAGPTSATFDVSLATRPSADVTISVSADAQATVVPSTLTISAVNWNVPQTITVTAVDDAAAELSPHTSRIALVVSSADLDYDALVVADVGVDVTDNDAAGVIAAPTSIAVAEGGSDDQFTVQLLSAPAANVTVLVDGGAQVTASPSSLTFTPSDWNVAQQVDVSAIDDFVAESAQHAGMVTMSSVSSDPAFDGMVLADVLVDITDNDLAGVDVAPTSLAVTEGGADDTFGVQLQSQPAADVTIAVTGDSQVMASSASLTFTAVDWNLPQTVTVMAVDDIVDETDPHTGLVTLTAVSADPYYDGIALPTVSVDVTDDDLPIPPDPSPPTGGSIVVPNMITNATSVPINFSIGDDAISGIDSWRVERRVAIYGGGGCTVFNLWTQVGDPSPASPLEDSYTAQQCVAYRLIVTDRAGNSATYSNETVLRIDRGTPFGSIDEAGADTNSFDGMASDLGSSTVTVDVRISGPVSIEACRDLRVTGGLWHCVFDDSTLVNGSYTITSTMRDDAGNAMTATRAWERYVRPADIPKQPVTPPRATQEETPVAPRDTTLPRLRGMKLAPITFEATTDLSWTATDDSGEEPVVYVERRASKARGSWSRWTTIERDAVSPVELKTGARGTTTCVRIVAVDAAGNQTSSPEKCTSLPLDDRNLAATRNWTRSLSERSFAETTSVAPRFGTATMSTRVSGYSAIKLVAATCSRCGLVRVYVGGRLAATVSLRSRRANPRAIITIRTPARAKGGVVALRNVRGTGAVAIDGLVVVRR